MPRDGGKTLRFAVGDRDGVRSSEWVISVAAETPDIYVASRGFTKWTKGSGAEWKASLHASGACHVKLPGIEDKWSLDVSALSVNAFQVEVPTTELRKGPWPPHARDSVWLDAPPRRIVAVGVFLSRVPPYQLPVGRRSRRRNILLEHRLVDGRWLEIRTSAYPLTRRQEEIFRATRRDYLAAHPAPSEFLRPGANSRLFILGTKDAPRSPRARCFSELAAIDEPTRSLWITGMLRELLSRGRAFVGRAG